MIGLFLGLRFHGSRTCGRVKRSPTFVIVVARLPHMCTVVVEPIEAGGLQIGRSDDDSGDFRSRTARSFGFVAWPF